MEVMQATEIPEPKTAVELLTARIRILISVTGLNRTECCETIMASKNPPTLEEFFFAYTAAAILTGENKTPSPNG